MKRMILALTLGAPTLGALLLATTARAEKPDVSGRKWARQCVVALNDDDARVRESASRAIGALGTDWVPDLVAAALRIDGEAAWTAFEHALARMGQSEAAFALAGCRSRWPKASVERLTSLQDRLEDTRVVLPSENKPIENEPGVEARVRRLLAHLETANSYSSMDEGVAAVIAIGRPAIPALVRIMREVHGVDPGGAGTIRRGAQDALAGIVDVTDVPFLRELVVDGIDDAALALRRIGGDAARDALLAAVTQGHASHLLVDALRGFAGDPAVHTALITWLEGHGEFGSYDVGRVAEFLGEAGAREAGPILDRLLGIPLRDECRARVAAARAQLGGKNGLAVLIDVLGTSPNNNVEIRDGTRLRAGNSLNRLTGKAWFKGGYDDHFSAIGNFDEAARQYREWWTTAESRVRFDLVRRRWLD